MLVTAPQAFARERGLPFGPPKLGLELRLSAASMSREARTKQTGQKKIGVGFKTVEV